jgi:hypothetical protein
VFDSPMTKAIRALASMLGANDPQSQVLALMGPMEVGPSGGLAGVLQKVIKAYHGSPHDFERFDMSKIGTGEGAQAYGHGLYFAESQGVAQSYRDALGTPTLKYKGQDLPPATIGRDYLKLTDAQMRDEAAHDLLKRAQKNMRFGASADDIVEYAKGEARVLAGTKNTDKKHWLSVERAIEDMRPNLQANTGRMYEVAIQADPEQFLDWDKPLSQQSEAVRAAVKRAGIGEADANRMLADLRRQHGGEYPTGADVYTQAKRKAGEHSVMGAGDKASALLRDKGIPGIKYLDQGSRAAGEGSHNYVVFDDALVEIKRKFGLAIAALAEAMRRQQPQPQEQQQ